MDLVKKKSGGVKKISYDTYVKHWQDYRKICSEQNVNVMKYSCTYKIDGLVKIFIWSRIINMIGWNIDLKNKKDNINLLNIEKLVFLL